jgi:S1-C subfamily serine protease
MRKKLFIIPILGIFIIYAVFSSYSHNFSSNNNNSYSLPDAMLYDKNNCFSPNDKLVDANNNNWTHIFENAKHSVVKVIVSNPFSNPEISTGFIYDNDGHIVTNYHVVNNANSINVTFADGNSYLAQITGTDPYSDLAVLQASAKALKTEQMKPLPIRNSSALQVGENVGTIGYPFQQLSFSIGSIKQLNILRNTILGYVQTGMIQHDACGFHGSSGGPLLDLKGQVLGVNSYPGLQGYDVPGLTLAIPSNTIQKIVPKLISQHSFKHPWLGVDVSDLSNFVVVNHRYGAVVQDVDPDGPAAKIGIEGLEPNMSSISDPFIVHDIITAINGSPIKNSSDFYNYIHNKSVGDKVVLTTMHDGVAHNFTITLGEIPSPF